MVFLVVYSVLTDLTFSLFLPKSSLCDNDYQPQHHSQNPWGDFRSVPLLTTQPVQISEERHKLSKQLQHAVITEAHSL